MDNRHAAKMIIELKPLPKGRMDDLASKNRSL